MLCFWNNVFDVISNIIKYVVISNNEVVNVNFVNVGFILLLINLLLL